MINGHYTGSLLGFKLLCLTYYRLYIKM
jgi:hypothetical protein